MNLTDRKSFTGVLLVLAVFVSAAATLRFAQDFFIPLVLAGLLSFLLSPLVRFLERGRIGRAGGLSDAVRADACQIVRQIIVGLWQPVDADFTARRQRLGKEGADETYPDLRRAVAGIAEFAACAPSQATSPG